MGLSKHKGICGLCYWRFVLAMSMTFAVHLGAAEKGAITVRLLAPEPMVCSGQKTVELEAVLTNKSEEPVELSQDGVVHSVSFIRYEVANSKSTGWLLDFLPGHWVTIASHQSVVTPFTVPLKDKLFQGIGLFSVSIDFGVLLKDPDQYSTFPASAGSNRVFFMIHECETESSALPKAGGAAPKRAN